MEKITRATVSFVALVATAGIVTAPTFAYKKYSAKEAVNCAYCHARPSGGGARNYRGAFYNANNLSFIGFEDAVEAKKAGVEVAPAGNQVALSLASKLPDATKKVAEAKIVFEKSKKDELAKSVYAAALADLARSMVFDPTSPEKTKLADAAKIAEEALALAPTNGSALKTKEIVEKMMKAQAATPPA